jgi:outer membrane protein assembly factor BamB
MRRYPLPFFLCLVLGGGRAWAQEPSATAVFPPTSQDYQVLWQKLDAFSREGDWEAVIEGLHELAELLERPETNLVVSNGAGMSIGVRRLLARYAERLPAAPRERWRARLDSWIERRWKEPVLEPLSYERRLLRHRILRDYSPSRFYPEALQEEADHLLLEGDWRGAREACLAWLQAAGGREAPEAADRLRALLILLHTDQALGDEGSFEEHRRALAETAAGGAGLPDELRRQVSAWIERPFRRPGSPAGEAVRPLSTVLLPQAAHRLSEAPGASDFRLGAIVWRGSGGNADFGRFVQERSLAKDGSRRPAADVHLPFHPGASGNTVIFQSNQQAVAVDIAARRERWRLPLEPAAGYGALHAPLCSRDAVYLVSGNALIAAALDSGMLLWKRALVYDRASRQLSAEAPEAAAGAAPLESSPTGPSIQISPPAADGGDLVVAVTVRVEREQLAFVLRLDAQGRQLWATFLGSSRSSNFLGLGAVGSPPCITGGTVLHLTNQGFVAAVDARDGTILWLNEYPTLSSQGQREAIRDENRWHPNPVLPLESGEALIAPQDSPFLLALRIADGQIAWQHGRGEHSTLLGHDGERCYLGGRQVRAVHLDGPSRGLPAWTHAGGAETFQPRGRALLLPDRLLLSGQDALLQLDPQSGRLIGRDSWDFPGGGGNLLLVANHLAVVHPGGFLLYSDREAERRRLANLPADRAGSHLERSKLHLKAGEVLEGLAALETWEMSLPLPPEPNSPLDRLHLEVADVLEQSARQSGGDELSKLLRFRMLVEILPRRKVAAAIELGLHLESIGSTARAVQAFHRALEFDGGQVEYAIDEILRVPADAFVREHLAALRRAERDPAAFLAVETAAQAELEQARKKGTPGALRDVPRRYPFTQAAAHAAMELATYYFDLGNYEQASRHLLEHLRDFPEREETLKVMLLAADVLYRSGRRSESKELYKQLLERHAEAKAPALHGILPGEKVGDYVRRRLADPGLVEVDETRLAGLRFPLRMSWRSPADLLAAPRTFLFPEGQVPAVAEGCFFTQAAEMVQCRRIDTGLPVWTVHLSMVPGFVIEPSQYSLRFARSGPKALRGAFVGAEGSGRLLVLHDPLNLFAIDIERGDVRWNIPFGQQPGPAHEAGAFRRLGERLQGVHAGEHGIFATSSHRRLYHYSLRGEKLWERPLAFDPAPRPPVLAGEEIFIQAQQRPVMFAAFRIEDGSASQAMTLEDESMLSNAVALGGGRLLIELPLKLLLVDLPARRTLWSYSVPRASIEGMLYTPDVPGEVAVVLNRANNWPGVAGVSLADGQELWRFEKFPARRSRLSLFRDRNRIFVIHGQENWHLVAIELRAAGPDGKSAAVPSWPEEVPLGTIFSERRLHIGEDSVIFPDPNHSVSAYDKFKGTPRGLQLQPLSGFLVEKGSFTSALLGGKLILLTDGGDCAFESRPAGALEGGAQERMSLVRAYLDDPASLETLVALALGLFREGEVTAAMDLLDRALTSEAVLATDAGSKRERLSYLLDGLKEEAMKSAPRPEIIAPRLRHAPAIDGELEDGWSYAHRVRLASPRNIGAIPAPGRGRDWEGEEDLSAILYTGWDDQYFYFALDVEDDVLRAYDRDADEWKGDCLLIGLDPEGAGGFRTNPDVKLMTLALTIPKRQKPKNEEDPDDPNAGEDGEAGDEDEDARNKPDGLFSVKKKDDNSGAVYEVALPWSSFSRRWAEGGSPREGFSFGLSLLLTDDDSSPYEHRGSGATKTLSINPCHIIPRSQKQALVWKFLIPEFFPRVVLR